MLNFRSNSTLVYLFDEITRIRNGFNKTELLNQAIDYAIANPPDWKRVSIQKISVPKGTAITTTFYHFNVVDGDFSFITEQVTGAIHLTTVARASYVVKLLLVYYLNFLYEEYQETNQITNQITNHALDGLNTDEFRKLHLEEKLNAIYEKLLYIESFFN
jgi:hypothetical protein